MAPGQRSGHAQGGTGNQRGRVGRRRFGGGPDRLTSAVAARDTRSAVTWSHTLPLDRQVAEIERTWGSVDNWLGHAPAEHRTRFAEVWVQLNQAIDDDDPEATAEQVARLLNGITLIDQAIPDDPPQARFFSTGEIAIAASSDDGAILRASGFDGRIYSADEMQTIARWFEERDPVIPAAKEAGGTVTDVRPRTELEEALDDEIPF